MSSSIFGLMTNDRQLLPCTLDALGSGIDILDGVAHGELGLGCYDRNELLLRRTPLSAGSDLSKALVELDSRVVLAHLSACGTQGCLPPRGAQPMRFHGWMGVVCGNVEEAVLEEETLAIPTYISRNMATRSGAEALFHQFLAFLHSEGRLDATPPEAARKALSRAMTLLPDFHGGSGVMRETGYAVLLTDSTHMYAAARGLEMRAALLEGIPRCARCSEERSAFRREPVPVSHGHVRAVALRTIGRDPGASWRSVEQGSVLQIGPGVAVSVHALSDARRT